MSVSTSQIAIYDSDNKWVLGATEGISASLKRGVEVKGGYKSKTPRSCGWTSFWKWRATQNRHDSIVPCCALCWKFDEWKWPNITNRMGVKVRDCHWAWYPKKKVYVFVLSDRVCWGCDPNNTVKHEIFRGWITNDKAPLNHLFLVSSFWSGRCLYECSSNQNESKFQHSVSPLLRHQCVNYAHFLR